jgi:hypothetical protein
MITDEHRKHVAAMMDAYGVPNLIAHDLVGIVHPNKAEMMENILNPIHRELVVDTARERGLLTEINVRICCAFIMPAAPDATVIMILGMTHLTSGISHAGFCWSS